MIKLSNFKQFQKIDKIDVSAAREWSEKSVKEKKEYAGTWRTLKVNDKLQIQIANIMSGNISEVSVPPTGWTWHTHPRGCPNLRNCSVIPPSANDFELFAQRWNDQHMVLSRRRIYWVKANRQYSENEIQKIKEFYSKLEKHFDDSQMSHDRFDIIFTLASKLGNFFKIYKFKNKKIIFL